MIKKTIMMLILAASLMTVAKAAEKYAVLITGDYEAKSLSDEIEEGSDRIFMKELWNDTYLQWELLVDKKGYKPENIIVLYRTGVDYWKELIDAGEPALHPRFTPQWLSADYPIIDEKFQITNFPATRKSLGEVKKILRDEKQINENDFLYVWTFGHGGSDGTNSFLCMFKENDWYDPIQGVWVDGWARDDVYDYDFDNYFVDLPAKKKVYSMGQCQSGGFKDNLTKNSADKSVYFDSSSKIMESAWPIDNIAPGMSFPAPIPFLEKEKFGDQTFIHSEYNFHKYGAYAGLNPQFQNYYHLGFISSGGYEQPPVYFIEADENSDGVVTVEEARRWNVKQNTVNETQDMSDPGNIGYHTSLDYATLLLKDDCNDLDSYVYENPEGLNGIVGISQLISTNTQKALILNNSNTTLLPNRSVSVRTDSKFSIRNSEFSGAGFDKSLLKDDEADFLLANAISLNSATLELVNANVSNVGISRARYSTVKTEGIIELNGVYFNLTSSIVELSSDAYVKVNSGSELVLASKPFVGISNSTIEVKNSGLISLTGVDVQNVGIIFNNNINSVFNGENSLTNSGINLKNSSKLTLKPFSKTIIDETSFLTVSNGSTIVLSDGSELIFVGGAVATFEKGSQIIIEGNAKITGNIGNAYASIIINDNSKLTFGSGSNLSLSYNEANSIIGGINSEVVAELGAVLNFNPTTPCIMGTGSKITVQASGKLYAYETSFSGSPAWNGIIAEVGSNVSLVSSSLKNAQNALSAIGASVNINGSSFVDCLNGISLVNCPDYSITNNRLIGKGLNSYGYAQGTGITLTSCSLPISGNYVQNYAEGIRLVSSSIIMAKNILTNNFNSGLLITGHGSKPILVNALSKDLTPRGLNNEIFGNNIDYPFYNGAQIYMRYSAGAYMTRGYNNIHSGQTGVVPSVPCIRGVINTTDPVISKVLIAAEENYWGYDRIDEVNQPDFFFFRYSTFDTGYSIDYSPYALERYTEDSVTPITLSSNEPGSTEATILLNAMKLEEAGNSKASIRLYENIIRKYPNTPEYYVAVSRLPGLYIEDEIPFTTLLSSFDEAIENETALGKKFFKGLRVSTHIKSKNYDTAILYAQEMKNEAETDEEALLSEIDIAVANMMKEAEGKGKNGNSSDQLEKLLRMLSDGKEPESSPTDIAENALPSQHELFQNYPNPFNPVTQIRFALAKAADVKLSVFNISGQKVADLANGSKSAGIHTANFDGSRLNSGVYYYTLEVDGQKLSKKMVLTK